MGEFDLKKLETSIEYVKRMAEGRNPVNNELLEDDSVLNNPNVIRCLYFIEDVLKEVQKSNGKVGAKSKRQVFPLSHLNNYRYQKDVPISAFAEQLNDGLDKTQYKKISYNRITKWLKSMGYLDLIESREWNKQHIVPTDKGRSIGIYEEERTSTVGKKYNVVMYNRNAQEFIVSNMRNILDEVVE